MFPSRENTTRTTAGVKEEGEILFEHEVGSQTLTLIPMVKKGKGVARSTTESWTIPLSLLEEVTLKGRARASGGGATIERHGSNTVTFTTGQREYRGTEFVKITIGRTEFVVTRRNATEITSTIRNLREHPQKYSR